MQNEWRLSSVLLQRTTPNRNEPKHKVFHASDFFFFTCTEQWYSSIEKGQIQFDCLVTKKVKLTLQYPIPTINLVKSVSCEYSNHMELQS